MYEDINMKKTIQVGTGFDFWVTYPKPELDLFRPIIDVFLEEGFQEQGACVYGGVHERDTGYESFSAEYSSFTEMEQNLIADFSKAEEELDGVWMTTLNFESMDADLEKDGTKVNIHYSRDIISIDGDIDARIMEKACAQIVEYSPARKDVAEKNEASEGRTESHPAAEEMNQPPVFVKTEEVPRNDNSAMNQNVKEKSSAKVKKKSFWKRIFG